VRGKIPALQRPLLDGIQRGTLAYRYKGVPCLKNPFDLALYQMLIGEVQPRTIVEIGSHRGGSALWFADAMRALSLPANVHSVDIEPVAMTEPGLVFHRGDANDLAAALPPELLRTLPRPWLVIEDASHQADTSLAVLTFFRTWLEPGEYLIVEDGIVRELGIAGAYGGGPNAAIERFMAAHPGDFEIDTRYCDWFGDNVTYNPDGYLRRLAPRAAEDAETMARAAERQSRHLELVKSRPWFYEFDLPDGSHTEGWPPEVQPIHPSRRDKLRETIARHVGPEQRSVAIDLAAHNGYFSFELARHFARVDAYELRRDTIEEARLIADALDVRNVTFIEADLSRMDFHPALMGDFVLLYGLLYHMEEPMRLLRLAAQLTRRHILIETAVFPIELTGQIEDGHYTRQRDVKGVFALAPDYPQASVGGNTAFALVPSLNALIEVLRGLGFAHVAVLESGPDDYEQFRRGSRVVVHGMKP
jgi:tRNA (mo5U34)-methyltransferase